jgi:hypothetical protein
MYYRKQRYTALLAAQAATVSAFLLFAQEIMQ